MTSRYSAGETVTTAYALLLTKLQFPRARLIRRPFYLRGGSLLSAGPGLTTGYGCRFDLAPTAPGVTTTLTIGREARLGDFVHIVAGESVTIGDNCLMASNIFISDTSHGTYAGDDQSPPDSNPSARPLSTRPVRIGDNVWIGEGVSILPGAGLGDGCIANAGAIVTKDFPAGCIVAGVPARIVKTWDAATGTWVAV
ncbi:MAG TPA: DapH/DapD/GlmU-related protein [Dermatophilaceae bacterium]|jgi:acetyltransferase-like isoleucine patch superfamily enzyme|nr:DapH/DapD/GlmU-related protein [Dermatophilaceae bacterium]